MNVKKLKSASDPPGFKSENAVPMPLLHYLNSKIESLRGKTFIGKGEVLFKFSEFTGEAKIDVKLLDGGGVKTLQESPPISISQGQIPQYLVFSEFLPKYTNQFCLYEVTLRDTTGKGTSQARMDVKYRF